MECRNGHVLGPTAFPNAQKTCTGASLSTLQTTFTLQVHCQGERARPIVALVWKEDAMRAYKTHDYGDVACGKSMEEHCLCMWWITSWAIVPHS